MVGKIDWSRGEQHVAERHGLDVAHADEAAEDPEAVILRPDPASESGVSVRLIGYSTSLRAVLTVIVLPADTDPADPPAGDWWGANAWRASARDQRIYYRQEVLGEWGG